MKMSENIDQWTIGMIAFRKDLKQPVKDGTNPFFKSGYVTFEGTVDAADDAIKLIAEKNGITYAQEVLSEPSSNTVSVTTIVSHVSGQYVIFGPLSLPVGKKMDAQAYGSSITYAKRYALSAALGISSDVDDDGNVASNVSHSSNSNSYSKKQKVPRTNNDRPQTISKNDVNRLEDAITQMSDRMNIDRKALAQSVFNYMAKNLNYKTNTFVGMPLKYGNQVFDFLDYVSNKFQQEQIDAQQKSMNKEQATTA